MRLIRKSAATILGLAAASVILVDTRSDVDFISHDVGVTGGGARSRADDALASGMVIIGGILVDTARARASARREAMIQAQRLRVLKATMRSVNEIVYNFIGSVQLFCLESEDVVPGERTLSLERRIVVMAEQLKQLSDLSHTPESHMAAGIGIAYKPPSSVKIS